MGHFNFCEHQEIKRIRNGENASDGIHPAFITLIQQTATRNGKQYVKRKGRGTQNGDIGIQPHAVMSDQTRFDVGRVITTQKSPGIRATQRPGRRR